MTMGAVLLAGIAPNLFVIAQAGYAKLSVLGRDVGLPAAGLLIGLYLLSRSRCPRLAQGIGSGALAGLLATLGLELVREVGYHL